MRNLVLLLASILPLGTVAQGTVEALDLRSGQIVPIANGDLGSGRIVARFLVSSQQLQQIVAEPQASGAVARSGANHITATNGYALRGTPVRDGVADCTQSATACYIVPSATDMLVLIVNAGERNP